MGASKHQQITKNIKNNHRNTPTVKTCKKTLSGRGKTSEIDYGYTLFTVFPEAQGSHNTPEMVTKMEPRAPKITKNLEKRALKKHEKHNTEKVGH